MKDNFDETAPIPRYNEVSLDTIISTSSSFCSSFKTNYIEIWTILFKIVY